MAFVDTQVRPQGEQIDAIAPSKMKLSAAIRIGAKIRPKCKRFMFGEGTSCALGAAYEAHFGFPGNHTSMTTKIDGVFALQRLRDRHPELSRISMDIWTKNDQGESRESIADWLQSQGL